jgi:hypothetical protein
MRFIVDIEREVRSVTTLVVDANNVDEARMKAIIEAQQADFPFSNPAHSILNMQQVGVGND